MLETPPVKASNKAPQGKAYRLNVLEVGPTMQRNGQWALIWINSVKFAERLVAFAVVETSFSLARATPSSGSKNVA